MTSYLVSKLCASEQNYRLYCIPSLLEFLFYGLDNRLSALPTQANHRLVLCLQHLDSDALLGRTCQ